MTAQGSFPAPVDVSELPIGVFDSGLGGLTVVRALRSRLPQESILYLGDTARIPYGTRSAATVVRYAQGCARVLLERGIKVLVVACNTVSAVALETLQRELPIPVIGVVTPGARAAVSAAQSLAREQQTPLTIGVLSTQGTLASGAYPRAVAALSAEFPVCSQAAPLWVPLVEEGWVEGTVPELVVEQYLLHMVEQNARVLVLGCTHYPLLKPIISKVAERLLGPSVRVVDGAEATAVEVAELLSAQRLGVRLNQASGTQAGVVGQLRFLVTDLPQSLAASAARFLGHPVGTPELVDIAIVGGAAE